MSVINTQKKSLNKAPGKKALSLNGFRMFFSVLLPLPIELHSHNEECGCVVGILFKKDLAFFDSFVYVSILLPGLSFCNLHNSIVSIVKYF